MILLALKLFWRDWRSGELTLLFGSLVIAVAIVTGISLFTDRLQLAVTSESSTFLAADRVLRSPRPIPTAWLAEAQRRGVQQAQVLNFNSMVSWHDALRLASVKAVDAHYPLKGHLEVYAQDTTVMSEREKSQALMQVDSGPHAGEIWVDSRLLTLLDITLGDDLNVGAATFKVTRIIAYEPDRGSTFFDFGPRVMMNIADLDATQVVQPGSRIEYRYLFSAEQANLEGYLNWLKPQLEPSHKLVGLTEGQPTIALALARSESFLLLAASLSVLLAGIAIALSSRRYSERHYDYVAVMKSLGANSTKIFFMYAINLILIVCLSIFVGWLFGWSIQQGFFYLLRDMIGLKVPAASWRPFIIGGVTALVCLVSFALPPLWSLRKVSPLRVLRDDLQQTLAKSNWSYALGLVGLAGLLFWYSRDIFAASAMLLGGALIFALVGAIAYWLLRVVQVVGMQAGSVWRLGVANLQRRLYANALQVVIFSLTFMLILMLTLVRTSLIEEWRRQIPEGTPNHFFINIAPTQMPEVENYLQQHQVTTAGLYPMVRGRLVELNDVSVATLFADKHIEGLDRELNLSWSKTLPQQNTIVAGQWWDEAIANGNWPTQLPQAQRQPGSPYPPVSIEQEFAARMELKVGDKLTFTVADRKITAEISNIRALRWDGMKPNFYIIFPPNVLNDLPATYITSFYLSTSQKNLINAAAKKFPTITIVELDPIIKRVDAIIDQVSLAVEIVLVLIVISGVLVLIASVQATMDVRYHENAILRTLGASAQLILGSLMIEFITLGVLSGILAAAGAEFVAFLVQTQVFAMSFQFHYWLWIAGPILGMLVVTLVGITFSHKVTRVSPLQVLRSI